MSHPTPGDLLELHFAEGDEVRRAAAAAHVDHCPACRAVLADVAWLEHALTAGPGDAPPADGLERVLARIEGLLPARAGRAPGWRAVVPGAVALAAGASTALLGGSAAALVFFAVGSILALSLAPVLILESQRRSS